MNSKSFKSYQLPEDIAGQQAFIDRAEEDLFCAVCFYRRGICGYVPYVNICFLSHQAIEKWLIVFIAITRLKFSDKAKPHDIFMRFEKAGKIESDILDIKNGMQYG